MATKTKKTWLTFLMTFSAFGLGNWGVGNSGLFFSGMGSCCFGQGSATASPSTKTQDPVAQDPAQESNPKKKSVSKLRQAEFEQFMRIKRDEKKRPVALETSITRYEMKNDVGETITVDLIGVVHVGEKGYYDSLNEQFQKYDATLYELVAPEGTRIPKGGRMDEEADGFNPIASLQMGMKSMLGLEFQLDHIDYMDEKLVHADMSPEEFLESMEMNEESFGNMFLKSIGSSMAMQNKSRTAEVDMVLSLFSKDKTKRLRRTMAEQMQDIESGMMIFNGKDGSTIINHRNAKVMEILKRELGLGKKKLAIFYGAGHLPDMQRRLTSDFQMVEKEKSWLTAWDLTGGKGTNDSGDKKPADSKK